MHSHYGSQSHRKHLSDIEVLVLKMQQINYLRKSFGNSPVKSSKTKSYNKKNDKIRVSILKFY